MGDRAWPGTAIDGLARRWIRAPKLLDRSPPIQALVDSTEAGRPQACRSALASAVVRRGDPQVTPGLGHTPRTGARAPRVAAVRPQAPMPRHSLRALWHLARGPGGSRVGVLILGVLPRAPWKEALDINKRFRPRLPRTACTRNLASGDSVVLSRSPYCSACLASLSLRCAKRSAAWIPRNGASAR